MGNEQLGRSRAEFGKLEFGGEAPRPLAKLLGAGNRFLTRPMVIRLFSSCHSEPPKAVKNLAL